MSSCMVQRIVFGKGVLLLLLSAVHTIAIPFEYDNVRSQMPTELGSEYAFWFGALGFYFALLGVVDILASKELGEAGSLAWRMALTSSLFATISGMLGLALLGPSPGLLLPISGVVGLLALLTPSRRAQVH